MLSEINPFGVVDRLISLLIALLARSVQIRVEGGLEQDFALSVGWAGVGVFKHGKRFFRAQRGNTGLDGQLELGFVFVDHAVGD